MRSENQKYIAVDTTLHGRILRPTDTFENAKRRAIKKGSEVIRVYGFLRFVLDTDTCLIYTAYQFSKDITEKLVNGTLQLPKGMPTIIDDETKKLIEEKEKRRLKNSTRVWRK